ncbi:glycerol-3-phosphate acyltransferase, putative [Perkinsus marinus ATCC 50983]|uniref:Glycerol-3-phosphate acyltransferase, putative n=2 Tax=Perkinsus marinus (strain ATCC 50983 / TXsc) TaxID=423536 RepID=C5K797_PERM5|nr:glycerol-3-phosphate acyltransferase, putative [Perkinsus marinus ATCC 50983]EER19432.1 glycerol-3-phosphate acyltransferase, putative [Perkinsus marinus ATCC 50983]|eukprot:XP_002787636.1 glycerol-3-phosphate acyltransferase, putative [Perkinsus marinus ATCC 50983]
MSSSSDSPKKANPPAKAPDATPSRPAQSVGSEDVHRPRPFTWSSVLDLYNIMRFLIKNFIIKVFYSRISYVGRHHIPPKGEAVIFVSNHPNQFVDGGNILAAVDSRKIRFITAAKSMRRPVIGLIAKSFGAVPVERSQDLAYAGKGTITTSTDSNGKTIVKVEGGSFDGLVPGTKLKTQNLLLPIVRIIDDSTAEVREAVELKEPTTYKIWPKLDQHLMYANVYKNLAEGKAIGIFPEGGSHDNVGRLLELKPGVAIMTLGALASPKHEINRITIVPIGLNYFEPYRFRSSLICEFGRPVVVEKDSQLFREYINPDTKRKAVGSLMRDIETAMLGCIIPAASYDTLQAIQTATKLYMGPMSAKITTGEKMEISKRMARVMNSKYMEEDEKLRQLMEQIQDYNLELKTNHIRDRDVQNIQAQSIGFFPEALWYFQRIVIILLSMFIAIPSLMLFAPVARICQSLSLKEKSRALAASSVKYKAFDVVASYKILVAIVIVPIYNLLLSIVLVKMVPFFSLISLPFVYFVFTPVAQYLAVIASDAFVGNIRRIARRIRIYKKGRRTLREHRNRLVRKLRIAVNEYGPKVLGPDFEEKRILKNEDVENIEDTQVSSLASAARSYLGSVKQDLHDFDVDVIPEDLVEIISSVFSTAGHAVRREVSME